MYLHHSERADQLCLAIMFANTLGPAFHRLKRVSVQQVILNVSLNISRLETPSLIDPSQDKEMEKCVSQKCPKKFYIREFAWLLVFFPHSLHIL
jgi:hypothetical protein